MSEQSEDTTNPNAETDVLGDGAAGGYGNVVYVFCIDANEANQLAKSLAKHNHEVISFSDLDEFRSAILIRAPHVVVLDIDSNAGQRAKKVFAHRVVTTFPVIYISKEDEFAPRLEAVRDGAEGYFIKPLDIEALSVRIDEKISKNEVLAYRILVVDDDEMLASYYEAVLSSVGMHVQMITSPLEILDALKKFKPELILTDLNMPECNGIEMAKIIRQNNRYLKVPIVFLSSVTEMETQMSAIETGADDFLTKPIDPEKLISAVVNRAERYRNLRAQS
jgi:DNA-binding response OmpR family regulator